MSEINSNMISAAEWASNKGMTDRRARGLCQAGRVLNAKKLGMNWIVPANAKDPRRGVGRPKAEK